MVDARSQAPLLYSQLLGQSVLDPSDTTLQKRIQGSFWVKLQRSEVADPESNYRLLAINILERAREKNYSASDMERACRRFELSQMYGDRIEVASFFEDEPEQLYPYSWTQRLHAEGKARYTDFDGYLIAEGQPLRWRLHDGKRLEGLELIVWQGKTVESKVNTPSLVRKDARKLNTGEELSHANKLIVKLSKELVEVKIELAELKQQLQKQIVPRIPLDRASMDMYSVEEIITGLLEDESGEFRGRVRGWLGVGIQKSSHSESKV